MSVFCEKGHEDCCGEIYYANSCPTCESARRTRREAVFGEHLELIKIRKTTYRGGCEMKNILIGIATVLALPLILALSPVWILWGVGKLTRDILTDDREYSS